MLLTWNEGNGVGRITLNETTFCDILNKPELSFTYTGIYYTGKTGDRQKYIESSGFSELSDEECDECNQYVVDFEFGNEFAHVVEADGYYLGIVRRVDFIEGTHFVVPPPPAALMIWNFSRAMWEFMYAIQNDGVFVANPPGKAGMFMVFPASWSDLVPKKTFYKYNFESDKWEDPRTLEAAKQMRILEARQYYEGVRMNQMLGLKPYEIATWDTQYNEAVAYLADQTALTPFIDAMMDARDNSDITKGSLCLSIIANHEENVVLQARIHGALYFNIDQINAATTIDAVDEVVFGF